MNIEPRIIRQQREQAGNQQTAKTEKNNRDVTMLFHAIETKTQARIIDPLCSWHGMGHFQCIRVCRRTAVAKMFFQKTNFQSVAAFKRYVWMTHDGGDDDRQDKRQRGEPAVRRSIIIITTFDEDKIENYLRESTYVHIRYCFSCCSRN